MSGKVGIFTVAVAALATACWAQGAGPGGGGGPRGPRGPRHEAIAKELGLTPDQTARLEKLRVDFQKARIQQRASTQIARLDLRQLMQASTVDEKAVMAKVHELSDLQAAGLKARVEHMLAMRAVLTPEQREKLKALRHEHGFGQGRRGGRPGMWQGGQRHEGGGPMGSMGSGAEDEDGPRMAEHMDEID